MYQVSLKYSDIKLQIFLQLKDKFKKIKRSKSKRQNCKGPFFKKNDKCDVCGVLSPTIKKRSKINSKPFSLYLLVIHSCLKGIHKAVSAQGSSFKLFVWLLGFSLIPFELSNVFKKIFVIFHPVFLDVL